MILLELLSNSLITNVKSYRNRSSKYLISFKVSGNKELFPIYFRLRNRYRNVCTNKREKYEVTTVNYLIDNCKEGKVFWKKIGKLTKSNIHSTQTIEQEQWVDYFKDVFKLTDIPVDFNVHDLAVYSINNHGELTCDMCSDDTFTDILEIYHKKKLNQYYKMCGKAAGPDDIKTEMFHCCGTLLMPYLVAKFNTIMSTGTFPSERAKGIIVPLQKKGDVNNVNNHCWVPLGKY